ncbi:hypothetical protein Clacol_006461 [Clathrus columnatus]|uniref:Anaphase-promoting complex subunit 5 n=1 Tax=Clathrus columnatus TaxID=1419009 RepID=A0AAV5AJT7_9AGAM|nr:hypothetical protein Clacol_006461 [Clathrus columnatus]
MEADNVLISPNRVLRPHHIGLLAILLLAYRRVPAPVPAFLSHLQRVLIEEIAELSVPRPYIELIRRATSAFSSMADVLDFERTLELVINVLNAVFERRSYFGLFVRRCCISYYKLSLAGVFRLQQDFIQWARGGNQCGYDIQETQRKGNGQLIFPTLSDDKAHGTASALEEFNAASAAKDSAEATSHLRKFFDQRFSDTNDSRIRQHALLNLALFHYKQREYPTSKKFLMEAINVARNSNDRVTLQHCMSLLRRFTPQEGSNTVSLTDIHPNISALYVATDVIKLIKTTKEPLICSFSRLIEAWGCYDKYVGPRGAPPPAEDQWCIHAVQSSLWKMAGQEALSEVEEDIVLAFTPRMSSDEARWNAFLCKAERLTRQGHVNEAVCLLLDPACWSGLDLRQYEEWARCIWRALVTRVIRRGQIRQYQEFFKDYVQNLRLDTYEMLSRSLPPSNNWDAIMHAKYHYKFHNTLSTIAPLLRGLFAAEFRGHWVLYRIGIIILADLAIDLGMPKYGRRILEEIMPQLISGDDLEIRAFGCYILSRCIVASAEKKGSKTQRKYFSHKLINTMTLASIIQETIPFLNMAEQDYGALEMIRCQQDVLYFLASVYNTLGMITERDNVAARHVECTLKVEILANEEVPYHVFEIRSIITEVGAKIAARSRTDY